MYGNKSRQFVCFVELGLKGLNSTQGSKLATNWSHMQLDFWLRA